MDIFDEVFERNPGLKSLHSGVQMSGQKVIN